MKETPTLSLSFPPSHLLSLTSPSTSLFLSHFMDLTTLSTSCLSLNDDSYPLLGDNATVEGGVMLLATLPWSAPRKVVAQRSEATKIPLTNLQPPSLNHSAASSSSVCSLPLTFSFLFSLLLKHYYYFG